MKINTSDFKNGISLLLEGNVYTIVEWQHVKPGKGGAFVRTRLKNLKTGAVIDRTFRAGEQFEQVMVERKPVQYLYNTGNEYVFMDMETYEQITLEASQVGDQAKYLKEGLEVDAITVEGDIVGIEVPTFLNLRVVETDPGLRGDTAQGGSKPAVLETGVVVQVPLFVQIGDLIKVDTRTDTYLERVKE